MKKPHVLNRPMFNTGGTSAYGRGITSNLVSDEQRQRFNYGGRVGLRSGTIPSYMDQSIYQHGAVPGVPGSIAKLSLSDPTRMKDWWQYQTIPEVKDVAEWEKIYGTESPFGIAPEKSRTYRSQGPEEMDYLFKGVEDADIVRRTIPGELKVDEEIEEAAKEADMTVEEYKATQEDVDDRVGKSTSRATLNRLQKQMEEEEKSKALTGERAGAGIADTNMLDIGEIVDKYYDKKAAAGEGLWRMAGAFATASQQSKKDAMATLGKEFGAVGQTLATDKKTRDKLKATGEIQREIYRQSRIAKGEADIKTAERKEEMLQARPDKEATAADTFKFFRTKFDFDTSVKRTLGDDVITIPVGTDLVSMKKIPGKIYQVKTQGGNVIYKMYDDNNQEIQDFNIQEYIKLLG